MFRLGEYRWESGLYFKDWFGIWLDLAGKQRSLEGILRDFRLRS